MRSTPVSPLSAWRSAPLALAFAVCVAAAPARAEERAGAEAYAEARTHYARGELTAARLGFETALRERPGDASAEAWLSRTESELSEDATGRAQQDLTAAAVSHAHAAVAAAPDSAAGHLALAIALGREALRSGPRAKLARAREVKIEVDRAIAIDPAEPRAWVVRGLWQRAIAHLNVFERAAANAVLGGVPKGASMDGALRDLQHATALAPGYVNAHLELGRTLMMAGRRAEARAALERAASLPPTSGPRDPRYQAEARELLAHAGS